MAGGRVLEEQSIDEVAELALSDLSSGDHSIHRRKSALLMLRTCSPVELKMLFSRDARILEHGCMDADSEVRCLAVGSLLGKLCPEMPPELCYRFVLPLLGDDHSSVRLKAVEVMGKLDPELLGKHSHQVVELVLKDPATIVRLVALQSLSKLYPEQISKHSRQLTKEVILALRNQALQLLWKVDPSQLAARALTAYLGDACETASQTAAWELLAMVDPELQGPGSLLKVTNLAASMDLQLPSELTTKMLKWRSSEVGNTLLHLAAQEGKLNACRYLVEELHLPVRELNFNNQEPRDLAQDQDVRNYLSNCYSLTQTRFGQGDAVQEALASSGKVVEVTWYTKRLPAVAGKLGGKHSFLVITLESACAQQCKKVKYILERARPAKNVQDHCGVFIGKWETHGPWQGNVLTSNAPVKGSISLSDGSLKEGITMQQLYDVQRELGPYHVANANCHHGALQAFNHCCAKPWDRVPEWDCPNRFLANLAPLVGFAGGASQCSQAGSKAASESRSTVSGVVEVGPPDSRSISPGEPDGRIYLPSGFREKFVDDVAQKQVLWEAAYLSLKVYDSSSAALPPKPTAAQVRNGLGLAVHISARSGLEKKGQPLVFQLQSQPLPDLEVLRFVPKTANRPIQWLLARSASALFLCFRGTDDLQDSAIDLAAIPLPSHYPAFGLGVHAGISAALEQEAPHVNVLQEVLNELQRKHREFEPLVLCGHSLGGGYAQIVALHLLHSGRIHHKRIKVQTFGAPHVVVPPGNNHNQAAKDLWHLFSSCSEHLVHAWDPVPRLPLCSIWLTDVVPKLRVEKFGFKFSLDPKLLGKSKLEEQLSLMSKYDVAGKVVMVSKGISEARCRASDCQRSQKELLSEVPPKEVMTVPRLPAYHSMADYLCIAEQLLQAPAA